MSDDVVAGAACLLDLSGPGRTHDDVYGANSICGHRSRQYGECLGGGGDEQTTPR